MNNVVIHFNKIEFFLWLGKSVIGYLLFGWRGAIFVQVLSVGFEYKRKEDDETHNQA